MMRRNALVFLLGSLSSAGCGFVDAAERREAPDPKGDSVTGYRKQLGPTAEPESIAVKLFNALKTTYEQHGHELGPMIGFTGGGVIQVVSIQDDDGRGIACSRIQVSSAPSASFRCSVSLAGDTIQTDHSLLAPVEVQLAHVLWSAMGGSSVASDEVEISRGEDRIVCEPTGTAVSCSFSLPGASEGTDLSADDNNRYDRMLIGGMIEDAIPLGSRLERRLFDQMMNYAAAQGTAGGPVETSHVAPPPNRTDLADIIVARVVDSQNFIGCQRNIYNDGRDDSYTCGFRLGSRDLPWEETSVSKTLFHVIRGNSDDTAAETRSFPPSVVPERSEKAVKRRPRRRRRRKDETP